MKVFIVFAAVVAVTYANAVGRVGWGAPALPSIDLETSSGAAAVGAGQAQGGQALLEQVVGDHVNPAILTNINGVDAVGAAQGEDLSQILTANKPSGATSTINAADVYNEAVATDTLDANLSGGVAASVSNDANTSASGQGSLAAEESSLNLVQSRS